MKLLVISDSHGRLSNARKVIELLNERISSVIHLGDMLEDARTLEAEYTGLTFHYVAGNCDFYFSAEEGMRKEQTLTYNGVNILITHGHTDGVKRNYLRLVERAKKEGAQVVLCGHTHEPYNKTINGILAVNPGSISFPRGESRLPSYAVLDIPDDAGGVPRAGVVTISDY